MTTVVLASARREHSGVSSAILNAARQAAGAIGVALFGSLAGDAPLHIVTGLATSALVAVALLVTIAGLAWIIIGRDGQREASSTTALRRLKDSA